MRNIVVLPLLVLLTLLTACNVDPNATPIVMFPSKIAAGTGLPTFSGAGIPTTPAPIGPTAIGIQPTTIAPTVSRPTVFPTAPRPTVIPTAVPPTAIPTLDSNWTAISDGIVFRRLTFTATGQAVGMLIVRIDPARVSFRVRYTPGQARSINDWLSALPGAKVIVNGNFFDTSKNAIGLIASDTLLFGRTTGRNDSGFFLVRNNAPRVRSLFLEPYSNTERFDQLMEGFPMLMVQRQVAPAFNPDLSNTPSRRTVIAQDTSGRILIMVTNFGVVNFTDLANWLGRSGLDIDTALNLDGGTSTAMYIATGGPSQLTPGLVGVPVVLAVFAR